MIIFGLVGLLLLLSSFFSGVETAYTSLSLIQIKNLSDRGKRGERIHHLTSHSEVLISAILIANNIVNVLASTLTTMATLEIFGDKWIGVSTGVLVLLLLILGEISPKQLALNYNETVAWWSADILYFLLPIFRPFVHFVTIFSKLITNLFKREKNPSLTIEGILQLTSIAENIGVLKRDEKSVFHSMIRSGNMTIASIVTHRRDIVSFEISEPLEKLYPIMLRERFAYSPLWEENPENIIGILYLQDVMIAVAEGRNLKDLSLRDLAHMPIYIPASRKIKELFDLFATHDVPMFVCLDEYGGLTGILTKDNLLREILGELYNREERPEINIQKTSENLYTIKGETFAHDFEEFFRVNLITKAQTIGGYLIEQIDRIPHTHEVITTPVGKFTIKRIKNNRILIISFIPSANFPLPISSWTKDQ